MIGTQVVTRSEFEAELRKLRLSVSGTGITALPPTSMLVKITRTLIAGAGLTGGGDLSADRTFAVGAGTGIAVGADAVSLSHLGLEALTNPGADRIFFWDNSEVASKWLTCGDSIVITTTTLDTIQDIRTSATPTFAGLYLKSSSAAPFLKLTNESDTARDPIIQFAVGATPVTKFTMGVDDSDSDKFKISQGSVLGTTDRFVISYGASPWIGFFTASPEAPIHYRTPVPATFPDVILEETGSGKALQLCLRNLGRDWWVSSDNEFDEFTIADYTLNPTGYGKHRIVIKGNGGPILFPRNDTKLLINDTSNAMMTCGLTIHGGFDENLALKSSCGHGMTSLAETDTYATFMPVNDYDAGLRMTAYGKNDVALAVCAYYTTSSTTKSSSGLAPIVFYPAKKSGNTVGAVGADDNLVAIRPLKAGGFYQTAWICDEDGDTWQSGTVTASRGIFDVAIGTAPLVITSTTIVPNLNVDLWEGLHLPALDSGKFLTNDGSVLEWDYPTFAILSDCPPSFSGHGGEFVKVKAGETGLEFVASSAAAHNLLSTAHGDTLADAVVAGDILIGNATPKWARLPKGTDGYVLTMVSGLPGWAVGSGGGGSAPDHAKYIVGAADGDLTAEKVKAQLYNNYDIDDTPASPNAMDDEFDDSSLDGKWTKVNDPGAPNAISETAYPGYLWVGLPELVTDDFDHLVRIYQAPPAGSVAWTFIIKASVGVEALASSTDAGEFAGIGVYIGTLADDELIASIMQYNDAVGDYLACRLQGQNDMGLTTFNNYEIVPAGGSYYLKLEKATANAYTSANTYNMYYSFNGITWYHVGQHSKTFTHACDELGICFRGPKAQGGTPIGYGIVDFFRRTV